MANHVCHPTPPHKRRPEHSRRGTAVCVRHSAAAPPVCVCVSERESMCVLCVCVCVCVCVRERDYTDFDKEIIFLYSFPICHMDSLCSSNLLHKFLHNR